MKKYCFYCMSELENEMCSLCNHINKDIDVPAHHLLPGTLLNNRYLVGMALGEGGFGITYIGRDLNLDMKIAIKEYYPNGYVNRSNTISASVNDSVTEGRKDFFEKGRQRFLSEARTLAKFSGEPGIVDVRDFFEENNTAYIIMEYLEGIDLKTYLKDNGVLSPEKTISILTPVMQSLKKVHSDGLIHRDISPDNIMIMGSKVKLLDFGAARSVSALANKSLSIMLKPGFAPEEQYRSKGNQGPWTDIYSLCATIYKCITGITPDDATQRMYCDEVKMPSALGIQIDPKFESALMKGMSVHQSNRYQTIDELIDALNGLNVDKAIDEDSKTISPVVIQEDDRLTQYGGNNVEDGVKKDNTNLTSDERKDNKPTIKKSRGSKHSSKKKKLFLIASICVVVFVITATVLLGLTKKNNRIDFDPYMEGFVATGFNPIELIMPEKQLSAEEVYGSIDYIEEMFYGDYSVEQRSKDNENIDNYKNNISYGALKDDNGRLMTNIPYRIESGPATLNRKINSVKEYHWMRVYYFTEDGYSKDMFAAYEVKDNKLHLSLLDEYEYNEETDKVKYKFSDQVIEYDFSFSGPALTLSYKEESVTLLANGFSVSDYSNDYFICIDGYSSSEKKRIDNIEHIYFYFSDEENNNFNLTDKDDNVTNECIAQLSMDGLLTFTYTDGHVKNTKYYTRQFVYFYCYEDGVILCDNENVYRYQKEDTKTAISDEDETTTDEVDGTTENNTSSSPSKHYSTYNTTKEHSISSTTTETIYSDTTQTISTTTSDATSSSETNEQTNASTTEDTIVASGDAGTLESYNDNQNNSLDEPIAADLEGALAA